MKCHYCDSIVDKADFDYVIGGHRILFCNEIHQQNWLEEYIIKSRNKRLDDACKNYGEPVVRSFSKQTAYISCFRGTGTKRRSGGTEIATKGQKDGVAMSLIVKNYYSQYTKVIDAVVEQDENFVTVKVNGQVVFMTKKAGR